MLARNQKKYKRRCRRIESYLIEYVGPTLERYALEHGEHGQAKVVDISDAVIGSLPIGQTDHSDCGAVESHLAGIGARMRIFHHVAYFFF